MIEPVVSSLPAITTVSMVGLFVVVALVSWSAAGLETGWTSCKIGSGDDAVVVCFTSLLESLDSTEAGCSGAFVDPIEGAAESWLGPVEVSMARLVLTASGLFKPDNVVSAPGIAVLTVVVVSDAALSTETGTDSILVSTGEDEEVSIVGRGDVFEFTEMVADESGEDDTEMDAVDSA